MTKYILAGGADRKYAVYGEKLAAEVSPARSEPLVLLGCFFAVPREEWEAKFADRKQWYTGVFGPKTKAILAFPDTFTKQVKNADIIYLHGGDDVLLSHYLNTFDNLAALWAGKTVIGSSAGADYLAESFWTGDWREVRQGSGLSGLNILAHYESEEYGQEDPRGPIDWSAAERELRQAIGPDKTVVLLREGDIRVVER